MVAEKQESPILETHHRKCPVLYIGRSGKLSWIGEEMSHREDIALLPPSSVKFRHDLHPSGVGCQLGSDDIQNPMTSPQMPGVA